MNLDDLRRLNIKEVGNWPLLPKIGLLALLFIAIVAAGAFFDWKDQFETLDKAQAEEGRLREQFGQKKAKAVNYDLYVAQLKDVEQSFGALVKQLPNRSEIDALLTDINQAGLGRGLQFELFRPAVQERMADFYAELPIRIKITGGDKEYEVTTGADGFYELYGAPAGKYVLEPVIPYGLVLMAVLRYGPLDLSKIRSFTIELKESACSGADIILTTDRTIPKSRIGEH